MQLYYTSYLIQIQGINMNKELIMQLCNSVIYIVYFLCEGNCIILAT